MQIYGLTDVGMLRHSNQDAFLNRELADGAVLSIVCDGMGGANAGNVASCITTKTVMEYVLRSYSVNMSSSAIENLLRGAVDTANIEVYDKSKTDEQYSGMGTTIVAALVRDNTAYITHVGDSRAYLISGGEIQQITRDHSVIQSLIEQGQITEEEARIHPRKNVITRAVGVGENVEADFNEVNISGSVLLLCTDGLSGMLKPDEIKEITENYNINEVPERLINAANSRRSNDNITVTVISL